MTRLRESHIIIKGLIYTLLTCSIGYGYQNQRNPVRREEDGSKNLVNDMEKLLDTGTLTDVTIKCERRTIKCHKAVLSARSAVFRAMFQHDMRENKHNEIIIPVMFSCHQVSTTM